MPAATKGVSTQVPGLPVSVNPTLGVIARLIRRSFGRLRNDSSLGPVRVSPGKDVYGTVLQALSRKEYGFG